MEKKSEEKDEDVSIDVAAFNKAKHDAAMWHNAYYEAAALGGQMYWDGATWGYAKGLEDKFLFEEIAAKNKECCDNPNCPRHAHVSPYGIAERASEIARDISKLIGLMRVSSKGEIQDLCNRLEPLTFVVTRYNTGDEILFQYLYGNPVPVRIKTHNGYFVDMNDGLGGLLTKDPKAELFQKDNPEAIKWRENMGQK